MECSMGAGGILRGLVVILIHFTYDFVCSGNLYIRGYTVNKCSYLCEGRHMIERGLALMSSRKN